MGTVKAPVRRTWTTGGNEQTHACNWHENVEVLKNGNGERWATRYLYAYDSSVIDLLLFSVFDQVIIDFAAAEYHISDPLREERRNAYVRYFQVTCLATCTMHETRGKS